MATIRALNNGQITALQINAPDETVASVLPARTTETFVILTHDVHTDKDWSYAERCTVNPTMANNIPNRVTNNNNQIVLPDINIS